MSFTQPSFEPVRFGILGAANIAREFMAGVQHSPLVIVRAVASRDENKARDFAKTYHIDHYHASYEAMLADPEIEAVYIPLPNDLHAHWAIKAVEAGKHVLCEKPMTVTVEEAEEIAAITKRTNGICAVNYGYSGYPLVREMRAMVKRGDLGRIRLIRTEFAHGFHADAADADNPRVRWRYDPAQAGLSSQFADCGIHALHLASFVSGQDAQDLSASFASLLPGRVLEDDAWVSIRMDGGALVRLWTSSVAIGRMHGFRATHHAVARIGYCRIWIGLSSTQEFDDGRCADLSL